MRFLKFGVFIRVLAGLCLALSLTSCSKIEWLTKWGDSYLAWKIIDQFDFEGDAKKLTKNESTQLIKDLQKKEFPKLADTFQKSAQEFSALNPSQEAQIQKWVQSKVDWADQFMDHLPEDIEPFAVKIASVVGKENWQAFQKSYEKENSKLLKEKSKCTSKTEDELRDWIGSLSDKQEQAVERYCETRKDSQEVRVRNRQHLMEVFRTWSQPAGQDFNPLLFQQAVEKWIQNYRQIQSPESQEKWKISKRELIKSLTEIIELSSSEQRKRFAENLQKKAQSFQKLSL